MLFNTIDQVKVHAGGSINANVDLQNLTAPYQLARDNHLRRYFGDNFLDYLEQKNIPEVDPAPTTQEAKAIELVGSALALLSLYEWTFTSSVQHGGEGMVRHEGETVKGAYKYQLNEYRAWCLQAGLNNMDRALVYCNKNADALPLWRDSVEADYHREVLIQNVQQLRQAHNTPGDRVAYETLRPLMYDLQEFVFVELLGQEQLEKLLASLHTPDADATTQALEAKLVKMLQRALAAFAVYEAMQRNLVQIKEGRIMQIEALEPQSTQKTSNPTVATINVAALQSEEFAERHLSRIRNFLTANQANLPLYAAWLESNQPDPEELYPNFPDRPTGRKVVTL